MRSNTSITFENFSDTFFKSMDSCLPYMFKDLDICEFIEQLQTDNKHKSGSDLLEHAQENNHIIRRIADILGGFKIPDSNIKELQNTIIALDDFIEQNSHTQTDQNQYVKSYEQYCSAKDQQLREQQKLNAIARALIKLRKSDTLDQNDTESLVDFKNAYDDFNDSEKRSYEDSLTREIYKIATEDTSITELDAYHYTNFNREIDIINLNTFFKQLNDQQDGLYQHNRRQPRVPNMPQAVAQPSSPISSKVGKVAMFMSFVAMAAATLLLSRSGPSIG